MKTSVPLGDDKMKKRENKGCKRKIAFYGCTGTESARLKRFIRPAWKRNLLFENKIQVSLVVKHFHLASAL